MNTISINGEVNLICFFNNKQLIKKRTELEDVCSILKDKYGSTMSDKTFKAIVTTRRQISRELNRRRQIETNMRITSKVRKQALTDSQVHKWLVNYKQKEEIK